MFPKFNLMKIYYQSDLGGGAGGNDPAKEDKQDDKQEEQEVPATFKTFDEWYQSLPDNVKTLANGAKDHFERMTATVRDTRQDRDALSENLKTITKLIGTKPEEAAQAIQKLQGDLESLNKKTEFYDAASAVECRNPKAAFAIATTNNLFKRDGKPDWESIKTEAPELFGKAFVKPPRKSAGSGTDSEPAKTGSMNDLIRKGAGYSS